MSQIGKDKQILASSGKEAERLFWEGIVTEDLNLSRFSMDNPSDGALERNNINIQLSLGLSRSIDDLTAKNKYALHVCFLSVVSLLMYRHSSQKRTILATPVYRQGESLSDLINSYLLIPFENREDIIFIDYIKETKDALKKAVANQNFPVDLIVENYSAVHGTGLHVNAAVLIDGLHDERYIEHLKPGLVFKLSKGEEGNYSVNIGYCGSITMESTIRNLAWSLSALFHDAINNPGKSLGLLNTLSQAQLSKLGRFNDTDRNFDRSGVLYKDFQKRAKADPDSIALLSGNIHVTYDVLNKKANLLARVLAKKGVQKDVIVAVLLEKSIDYVVTTLAIQKIGGVVMPLSNTYPLDRVMDILNGGGVDYIITNDGQLNDYSFIALRNIQLLEVATCTASVTPVSNFDSLPFIDRGLIDYSIYHKYIGEAPVKKSFSIQATRGCPFSCIYCHKIWPKKHVARSAENLFEEIDHLYKQGAGKFVFIDDVFNLNNRNINDLMHLILRNKLDVNLYFPNGLRGDILTTDTIDLMVEAGAVNIDLALETASPRLQKLIKKNLNLDKFLKNITYLTDKYPHVILELETMHGFPTETEEEALETLEFLKNLKWVHFPYLNILRIYPNTEMYQLAIENGIDKKDIYNSIKSSFHELPSTLPFSEGFTRQYQSLFMNEYVLNKDRIRQVLPYQLGVMMEDEIVQKYNSYLPNDICSLSDLANLTKLPQREMRKILRTEAKSVHRDIGSIYRAFDGTGNLKSKESRTKVLLLDVSLHFSTEVKNRLYDVVEEPLGLMYLLTYLNENMGKDICGRIAKSRVDFDSMEGLYALYDEFKPDIIGIRSLSFYKEFFHKTVHYIRNWGFKGPLICGGPYSTTEYDFILNDGLVDIAVLGEGEITFAQLVKEVILNNNTLPADDVLGKINGIAYIPSHKRKEILGSKRNVIILENERGRLFGEEDDDLDTDSDGTDLLYAISTSGTSGKPKISLLENRNFTNLLYHQQNEARLDFGRVLMFASLAFDVSFQEIYSTLIFGGELFVAEENIKFDVLKLFAFINRHQITTVFLPPSYLNLIFTEKAYYTNFPENIKYIIAAGEQLKLNKVAIDILIGRNIILQNHYGPSESHVVTIYEIDNRKTIPEYVPIGKPVSNNKIHILNGRFHKLPFCSNGEIVIEGENVGRGYLNDIELTHERFGQGQQESKRLYFTGDVGKIDSDGNLVFVGRNDKQVQIRGYRVELAEIEKALSSMDRIKEAVVLYKKIGSGDGLACYYTANADLNPEVIKKGLMVTLPEYMIPQIFFQLEAIPLTDNGKIDHKRLPDPNTVNDRSLFVGPSNPKEEKLLGIWSKVLEIDRSDISMDSNFFELGGNSLSATHMIALVQSDFNKELSLDNIFRRPTIKHLAEVLLETGHEVHWVKRAEKRELYKVLPSQKRIFVLNELYPGLTTYNVTGTYMLNEAVDAGKFTVALTRLMDKHISFKLGFVNLSDEPYMFIGNDVMPDVVFKEVDSIEGYRDELTSPPFDLGNPPLLKVGVYSQKGKSLVVIHTHHIICDGYSLELFYKDLYDLYHGGYPRNFEMDFIDYTCWANNCLQPIKLKQQKYWRDTFASDVPVLELPADYFRPAHKTYEGDIYQFKLNRGASQGLEKLCEKYGVTMFNLLFAAYSVFLSKLSRQNDIVIGTPVSGRHHPGAQGLIGMFVNTLAVRVSPQPELTFEEYLKTANDQIIDAFANQDCPFEDIVEEVVGTRDMSRNPLFETMFAYRSSGTETKDEAASFQLPVKVSKFDLTLNAHKLKDEIHLIFEYSVRLFKKETIEKFAVYFNNMVDDICVNDSKTLAAINVQTDKEVKILSETIKGIEKTDIHPGLLHKIFIQQAKKYKDKTAVCYSDQYITYRELNHRSDILASKLNNIGACTGSIVALISNRCLEMQIAILGILKAGCAYLPINPGEPEERLNQIINDSGTQIIFHTGNLVHNFSDHIKQLDIADPALYTENCSYLSSSQDINMPAYVIYTSGSTGKPKGVIIEHSSLFNRIFWMQEHCPLEEMNHILHKTPFTFDVSVWELFWWFWSGTTLYMVEDKGERDPELIFDHIIKNDITVLHFVPSMLGSFLQWMDSSALNFSNSKLKYVICSGEELLGIHGDLFYKLTGNTVHTKLINLYGPTEATIDVSYFDVDRRFNFKTAPIPIGKPIYNTRLSILSETEEECAPLLSGELAIEGVNLARGYLNRPELTNQVFVNNIRNERIYKTGDKARFDLEGNIIFMGRSDHQVKIRGYRIELGEIEQQMLRHDKINEAVAMVIEHHNEKLICAYFTGREKIDDDELREYLSLRLPSYFIPSYFVELDRIPLTSSGKINRKDLPVPEIKQEQVIPPRDEIETKLQEIWSKILKIDQSKIGINSNFFHLGGHSLKVIAFKSQVSKIFNINLPLIEFFNTPFIVDLAKSIKSNQKVKQLTLRKTENKEFYNLSPAQLRVYAIQAMNKNTKAYNMPQLFLLKGRPNKERISQIFNELISFHDAFKTSFLTFNGNVVQKVCPDVIIDVKQYETKNKEELNNLLETLVVPFDLTRAPLLRVNFIINDNNDYYLLIDMHHIISDGISQQLLHRQFKQLYGGEKISAATYQYKDYIEWQQQLEKSNIILDQKKYWLNKFKNGFIPLDFGLTVDNDVKGLQKKRIFCLPKDIESACREIIRTSDNTLFVLLLAVYNVLLSRYTMQRDIIVGIPVSGRTRFEFDDVVGLFVNLLPAWNIADDTESFASFLNKVRDNCFYDFENQDFQFNDLLNELQKDSRIRLDDIIKTVFVYQKLENKNLNELNDTDTSGDDNIYVNEDVKFPLTLGVNDYGNHLSFDFEFDSNKFSNEIIEEMIGNYIVICKHVVTDLNYTLSNIKESLNSTWGYESDIKTGRIDADFEF